MIEVNCEADRSLDVIANEVLALASEYRRVSACVLDVERRCAEAGVHRDQVLEIAFTHAVSYIDEAAEQLEQLAERLADRAGKADLVKSWRAAEGAVEVVEPFESASAALGWAAVALETSMNRALDLVDEIDDESLVGDTHPFGHVIQGICIPYIALASAALE